MSTQDIDNQNIKKKYQLKKSMVMAVGTVLFLLSTSVAYVLCNLQIRYSTQEILNTQRDINQSWIDKSIESIRAWQGKVTEQARFISTAEMFRLFATDTQALGEDGIKALASADAATSSDEGIASLAEQLSYMRGILQDVAQRRNWQTASIVTAQGNPIVTRPDAPTLSDEQKQLIRRAEEGRSVAFGAIRQQESALVMDLVDPMYGVLGADDSMPVAFMLVTLPMDDVLHSFLLQTPEQNRDFRPLLLSSSEKNTNVIGIQADKLRLDQAKNHLNREAAINFTRRTSATDGFDVYSLGSRLNDLNWVLMLETPASTIDEIVKAQEIQIYGLGILGSLGIALLIAFVWASLVSRSHRATAQHFQKLYALIRQQKLMLDSINASLQTGLLLVGGKNDIQVCNPAFCQLAEKEEGSIVGKDIAEVFPLEAADTLHHGMEKVAANGKMDSIEVSLPLAGEPRLYRVTLFPFEDLQDDESRNHGGCVGIFQDITEFRRKAKEARERQASIIMALVRAIESVDVNLIGHSLKMEKVSDLLSEAMSLPDKDRETLRLAARLSQVGKIFVPHHLLTKKGKLTPEEQYEVQRAPEYAYNVLRDLQFGLPVPEAVSQMGEHMDGTGQPRGLKGEEIVLNARILAVINAFCAMVSARSYRSGMDPNDAINILSNDSRFDPKVVATLSKLPVEAIKTAIEATPAD